MEPPPDLEDVYRPFEDPGLKNVEEQTEFREHELGELGDLLGLGRSTQDSSEVATSGSGGVVDLSFQEKAEQAKAAPQTMCKMLPEQVTQRVDCLAGRWVPTYMRQQLAAGGHTSLPSAPNGHEFSASAQPPSCGQAFIDMGHDFGEGAQAVLEFMAAFFTSLTFQCQACSHHAISTAHEQVMVLGDDWCGFAETEGARAALAALALAVLALPILVRLSELPLSLNLLSVLSVLKLSIVHRKLEAIASRLEAIAIRLEAIASRLEAIAISIARSY
eukprot:g32275.t1